MRAAARVVWDKDLFGTWTDVGQQPATAMSVVVIEVARRPSSGVIDSRVVIPEGLVVGEDPELDAKRFRRTANGVCLITRPMIDRLTK